MRGNCTATKFPPSPLAFFSVLVLTTSAAWSDWRQEIGFTRLQELAGPSLPTAPTDGVSQIEAREGGVNYAPDTALLQFADQTFQLKSGSSVVSAHATTVAKNFYGTTSLLPGAMSVDLYSANEWLGSGFLNSGTRQLPDVETRAVQNHSWIGSTSSDADTEAKNRRLDFAIKRDGFVCVVGENNGASGTLPALLGTGYHTISVGRSDGQHSRNLTSFDGSGRSKPDIVAPSATPNNATSFTTPMVAGTAGLLVATLENPPFSLPRSAMPRLVKAILLASARRDTLAWNQSSTAPLDPVFGAGLLNAWRAYDTLLGGPAYPTNAAASSWKTATVAAGAEIEQTFLLDASAPVPFGAALVWYREVTSSSNGRFEERNWISELTNLSLKLHLMDGSSRGPLVAASNSPVDNLELIHQSSLVPGKYTLVVTNHGTEATDFALAWHTRPSVFVATSNDSLDETNGSTGSISLTRSGQLALPLKVFLTTSGTAVEGTHYQALADEVVIPAGQAAVNLVLSPISDDVAQGQRTIAVSASPDFSYSAASMAQLVIDDKPYDQWRFDAFPAHEANDPAISEPGADADFDQLVNLLEYAFGLDPKSAEASPITFDTSGTHLSLSCPKNPQATDLLWSAEVSEDLSDWQPAITTEDTQTSFSARDSEPMSAGLPRFIRIVVEQP